MNIFVGNLSFDANGGDVKKLFEGFGGVASVEIVMSKEKKAPKSRGFGFVQMPDEQQALAAIAALNGKEFMGRPLNVSPAHPKTEADRKREFKKKAQPKFEARAEGYPKKEGERGKTWFSPVFNKPGTYRGGRRTRSYMSRRGLAGMQQEAKPRKSSQDNPMRWRKKKDQVKPWQKGPGEHKPRKEAGVEARPWKKAEGGFKPKAAPGTSPEFIKGRSQSKSRRRPGGYKR